MLKRLIVVTLIILSLVGTTTPLAYASATTAMHTTTPHTSKFACSGYGCDNFDVNKTGCNQSFVKLGRIGNEDTTHIGMYWSNSCHANFASVLAPSGSLEEVDLERADQPNTNCNQVACTYTNPGAGSAAEADQIITCVQGGWCAANGYAYWDYNNIPVDANSWQTNMLYAPNQQVRVEMWYYCGQNICHLASAWH